MPYTYQFFTFAVIALKKPGLIPGFFGNRRQASVNLLLRKYILRCRIN